MDSSKKIRKTRLRKKTKTVKGGRLRKRIQHGSAILDNKRLQNKQNISGNRFYKTITLEQKIIYVIPSNFRYFQNINSFQVPAFNIFINNKYVSCNLKYKKNFINYLVVINNEWYASMRIVGEIFVGLLASFHNTIFYKFSPGTLIFNTTNYNISFNPSCYTKTKEPTIGILRSNSDEILIFKDKCLVEVENRTIYNLLDEFRTEQLIAKDVIT
jgi:hypothetical protein